MRTARECARKTEKKPSVVRLDGDVHGPRAECADEEPGEAAGAIDGEKFEVVAGGNVQIERLPIPRIVDAQAMPARSHRNRHGIAVHEFGDRFAVELHDNLAELNVVRRGAADGDLRLGSLWRGGGHGRTKAQSEDWLCLLLEKILEGLAGVVVPRRGRRSSRSSLLRIGRGRGIFFHRGAKFVERAVVLRVLRRNALGNGLGAFKLRAAVEEAALFATVQLEGALGTLAAGVEAVAEYRAAIGTASARYGTDHARRARTELIGARTALRRLAVMRAVLLFLLFRVAITAVIVLSIHKTSYNIADETAHQGALRR